MGSHILKCKPCGIYTMKKACPKCALETNPPRPPKYSPEDKYSNYRRIAKRPELERAGLL